MLNNLKYQYANRLRWDLALEMLDYQLALALDDGPLRFERGSFGLRLGAVDAARRGVSSRPAWQVAPAESELATSATAQLAAIAGQHNTRH